MVSGVLEAGGQALKDPPGALERSGQIVSGVIKAKQESKPFVEEVRKSSGPAIVVLNTVFQRVFSFF